MQEIWKSIEGYEGKYEISNLGRVKSLYDKKGYFREKILTPRISKNGYLYINLWSKSIAKSKKIHRMVASAFCDKPENAECVNHKNGVKTDNRADNLEWCTYSYNTKHAIMEGLMTPTYGERDWMFGLHGADNPFSKPVCQYTMNGDFIKSWENSIEAGKALNVNGSSIQRCARGKRKSAFGYRWKYLGEEKNADKTASS